MSDTQPRLTRQQQQLCDLLEKTDNWTPAGEIAKTTGLSSYNVKQTLNILVDRGILVARRKPGDPTCYRVKNKVQST